MVRYREGVTERAKVPHDLVNIRSSWFPALCVGGEGESVKSKVVKKLVSSGEWNFYGRMLKLPRITSGVPFSGKQRPHVRRIAWISY